MIFIVFWFKVVAHFLFAAIPELFYCTFLRWLLMSNRTWIAILNGYKLFRCGKTTIEKYLIISGLAIKFIVNLNQNWKWMKANASICSTIDLRLRRLKMEVLDAELCSCREGISLKMINRLRKPVIIVKQTSFSLKHCTGKRKWKRSSFILQHCSLMCETSFVAGNPASLESRRPTQMRGIYQIFYSSSSQYSATE